ncbi:hypothetical protein DB728_29825 [Rhizobium leguminosarum bv. viciae USDA 2370]|nr:hypothetical protein CHR56_37910 [Rhizobium leguminosarum bv. viciae]PUB61138.1 hypothetical protein DB728_29825 [Rhizobium leguminosarum bv. viciae USDA 2370]
MGERRVVGRMHEKKISQAEIARPLAETLRRSAASYDGISVILDWYCDRLARSWKETHRVS